MDVRVIYTLELEGDKYYVGSTMWNRLDERFDEHCRGQGASWTREHAPIKITSVIVAEDDFSEERMFLEMCREHGPDRVRGASSPYSTWSSMQHVSRQVSAPFPKVSHVMYVLYCKSGRAYVEMCRTRDVAVRVAKHYNGMHPFTACQKPCHVDIRHASDPLDVEIEVLRLASRYGVENVRGGSFSDTELHRCTIDQLQRQVDHAQGRCFKCRQFGHYAPVCSGRA
jgi:predicted GIY-YIG superfamily endonuclease